MFFLIFLLLVQEAGSVAGDAVESEGVTTINAVIKGGHPAANTYKWTVQQPDGSHIDITPGQSGASAVVSLICQFISHTDPNYTFVNIHQVSLISHLHGVSS